MASGLWGLALEWHENLAPVVEAFLATGTLADHWLLWPGDGRITAGHLVVPQWSHGWPPARTAPPWPVSCLALRDGSDRVEGGTIA